MFRTPLRRSDWLSDATGADVFLKLEVVQPTGSYKIRGAFNAALRLSNGHDPVALVAASAGNHGRALAYAARAIGLSLTVFLPDDAPRAKTTAIRGAGADLRLGADYDDAERQAKAYAITSGGCFISPYSHPDVIAGAGTIMLEIAEDMWPIETVVVPIGGGGLISGIGIAARALQSTVRIVGVEAAASCPFTHSLVAGHVTTIEVKPSIADGLVGNLDPDTITFDVVRRLVDHIDVVQEHEIEDAVAEIVRHEHLIAEGAAAVGPAALLSGRLDLRGERVAVILTGSNIDPERLEQLLTSNS